MKEIQIKSEDTIFYRVLDNYYKLRSKPIDPFDMYEVERRLKRYHNLKKMLYVNRILRYRKKARTLMFRIKAEQDKLRDLRGKWENTRDLSKIIELEYDYE